jgi:hypothetical protein
MHRTYITILFFVEIVVCVRPFTRGAYVAVRGERVNCLHGRVTGYNSPRVEQSLTLCQITRPIGIIFGGHLVRIERVIDTIVPRGVSKISGNVGAKMPFCALVTTRKVVFTTRLGGEHPSHKLLECSSFHMLIGL